MEPFTIQIAGLVTRVHPMFSSTREYCRSYLSELAPEFDVVVTAQDLVREQELAELEAMEEGLRLRKFSDPFLERAVIQRKIARELLSRNTVLLHGSTVAVDGAAYLFTAPCGTGKSTQAELWRRYRNAQIINGDKAIVYLASEGVSVSSLPLCGSSGICRNVSGPVQAIVTLSQSRENRICRLGGKDAVKALLSQLYVQRGEAEAVAGALALASGIAGRVPVFHLSCLPEVSAVECLEKAMKEAQCDAG